MDTEALEDGLLANYCKPTPALVQLARRWRQLIRDFERSTGLRLGAPPPVGSLSGGYPVPSLLDDGWLGAGGRVAEAFWLGRRPREVVEVLSSEELREAVRGLGLADVLTSETVEEMRKKHASLLRAARAARDWTSPAGERLLAYLPGEVADAVRVVATSALKVPKFATVRTGKKGRPGQGSGAAMRQAVRALDVLKAADGRDLTHDELTTLLMLTVPWRYLDAMKSNEEIARLADRVRKLR